MTEKFSKSVSCNSKGNDPWTGWNVPQVPPLKVACSALAICVESSLPTLPRCEAVNEQLKGAAPFL